MEHSLRILLLDDDEVDRMAVCRALSKIEVSVDVSEAANYEEATTYLNNNQLDCVFLDYRLPGKDGLAVVKEVRAYFNAMRRFRIPKLINNLASLCAV